MEGVGSACPPHGALGWDMVAAAPALLWQNWGAFMGYSAGTSSGPPVPRIQCIQCILGVAHLLKVEAGNLCKKRPDPTSCPRPGGIHDHWGGKEPDLQVPGQVRVPSHQAGLRPVRDSPWGESPLARSVLGRISIGPLRSWEEERSPPSSCFPESGLSLLASSRHTLKSHEIQCTIGGSTRVKYANVCI